MSLLPTVGLLIFFWVKDYSVVYVESSGSSSKTTSFMFIGSNLKKIVKVRDATELTTLLPVGEYTVYIANGDKTFVSHIKTKGFLRKALVKSEFRPEARRNIVATNPSPCLFSIGTQAYSNSCNESLYGVVEHVRATESSPTYIQPLGSNLYSGDLYGIQSYGEGSVTALLKDSEGVARYSLQTFDRGLRPGPRVVLDINPNKDFLLSKINGKPFVIARDFSEGFSYDIAGNNKMMVFSNKNSRISSHPMSVDVKRDKVILLYSPEPIDENTNKVITETIQPEASTLTTLNNRTKKTHVLDGIYSKALFCGNNICLLNNRGLSVFRTNGDTLSYEYTLPGIRDVLNNGDGTKFISDEGVVAYDTDTQTGFIEYSFGGMRYCGQGTSDTGYILCLIDNKLGKVGIKISPDKPNNGLSIDKKAAEIAKNPAVDTVSVNGKFVFVAPKYTNIDSSSRKKLDVINSSVDGAVNSVNINKNTYRVIVLKQ